jgi:glycosyltransferase involved in cell wall biosynthesis
VPEVSVIVPNYNHAPYLTRRIESVLSQTYRDFELLILDDASPDTSRDIASRYLDDPRVRIEFNATNSGNPYLQWRKGLSLTSGKYVWIAESDDYAEPTFLERLLEKLERYPQVGIAVCESKVVDETDRLLHLYGDLWKNDESFVEYDLSFLDREVVVRGQDYCRRLMVPWNTIPNASAAVFRRAAFEAVGGPVTHMKLCGDWFTYCKILMRFDIARIPEHLNYFRHHAVNVRSRIKPAEFVAESREVRDYVARELGIRHTSGNRRRARNFDCQALISADRRAPANKVPLSRVPRVLSGAARFGLATLVSTTGILLWEQAAQLARKLGWDDVRRKWQRSSRGVASAAGIVEK